MSTRQPKESDTQKAFFTQVQWLKNQDPRWNLVFAFPNEFPMQHMARRNQWLGHLKSMGSRPGFPDIFVFLPNHDFAGLAIELKRSNGKLRDSQEECLDLLQEAGYCACVLFTDSAQDIVDLIQLYFDNELECATFLATGKGGSRK